MTAMAFAVGFVIVAIVAVSRTLPAVIAKGLAATAPAQDSGWSIIVHSSPTGVLRGVQLSLLSERRVQYVGPPHVETVASRDVRSADRHHRYC
jgi:hypothetical protein